MKTKRVIVFVLIFVLVSAVLFYHLFSDNRTTIYAYYLGQEAQFELAKAENVSLLRVVTHYDDEHTIFRVPDKEAFIEEYVLTHSDFVVSYELYHSGAEYYRTFYIFEHDNILYGLHYNDNLDIFRMNHIGAYIEDFYVPFPTINFFEGDYQEVETIPWKDIRWEPWESFEDAAAFYEKLSDVQSMIDYEEKTIRLNGYDYTGWPQGSFSDDYPVILRFDDEGFSYEVMD